MGKTVISTLVIDLVANSSSLSDGLKKPNKKTASWATSMRSHTTAVAKGFGLMSVAAATALGAIYKSTAPAIDATAKLADQMGVTTETLGGWRYVAELTGVSNEKLDSSVERMVKRLGEAEQGIGMANVTLKQLGLSNDEFFAKRPDEQFGILADKVSGLSSSQEKSAVTAALFGREGLKLINTLELGADGMADLQAEATLMGAAISRIDAAKVEAANDSFTRVGLATKGLGNSITVGLAPYVTALGDALFDAAKDAGGFGEITTSAMNAVVQAVGYGANVVRGLQVAWSGVVAAAGTAVEVIVTGMMHADQAVTRFLNRLPGVEATESTFLKTLSESMSVTAQGLRDDLYSLATEELPYDGVIAWSENIQRKAREAAEGVAANTVSGPNFDNGDDNSTELRDARFQSLTDELRTEEEKINASHQLRQELILNNTLEGSVQPRKIS